MEIDARAARLNDFLRENPDYFEDPALQASQGATNFVKFLRHEGAVVVAKVFHDDERKQRECFALRHWQDSGLVPALLRDDAPHILITSFVPGEMLRTTPENPLWRADCHAVGHAAGRLTRVPLDEAKRREFESRFYADVPTLEIFAFRILALGRGVASRDSDFSDSFWRTSLDHIENQLPLILREKQNLYHQDAANLHVENGRFMGFFDFEMSRVGGVSMQLASCLGMLGARSETWQSFREGWEAATGLTLGLTARATASAAFQLLGWREITRYLSYDGTPGSGFPWAGPADPLWHRERFQAVAAMFGL